MLGWDCVTLRRRSITHPQVAPPWTGKSPAPDEVHKLMTRYSELVHIDQKYNLDPTPPVVSAGAALPQHRLHQGGNDILNTADLMGHSYC